MTQLFYAYATADARHQQDFEKQLRALRQRGAITGWDSRSVGATWRGEASPLAKKADVVLLLMSSDLISSGYLNSEDVGAALARHRAGEARLIPVLLRPCNMKSTPVMGLPVLPRDGKPVTRWASADVAFQSIVAGIVTPTAAATTAAADAAVAASIAAAGMSASGATQPAGNGTAPAAPATAGPTGASSEDAGALGALADPSLDRIALPVDELGPGYVAVDQPKGRDDEAGKGSKFISLARAGDRRVAQLVYRTPSAREAVARMEAAIRAEIAKGGHPTGSDLGATTLDGEVIRRVASAGPTPQGSVFGAKGRFLVAAKVMGGPGDSAAGADHVTLSERIVRRMLRRIPD